MKKIAILMLLLFSLESIAHNVFERHLKYCHLWKKLHHYIVTRYSPLKEGVMNRVVFLILFSVSFQCIGQDYRGYLEQYWYFRHQLKDKFMYYNGDASAQGAHLIAENKNDYESYIRWADGVWWMGHYLSVLSIEYLLLQRNNQDLQETIDEINLVFDTYERLDYNAEPCFNDILGDPGQPSINGFFLRDDLDISCSTYFNGYEILADYVHCQDGTEKNVNSQDQCIMMFLGLNMIKKLVGDSGIQDRSEEIGDLIVERLHYYWPPVWTDIWEIRNPVTLGIPEGGAQYELKSYRWAMAEAAGQITGDNEHAGGSYFDKGQFDVAQALTWDMLQGGNPIEKFVGYFTMVLAAVVNDGDAPLHPGPDGKAYDWLYDLYNKTKGYEGMPFDVGLFPHLPAINEILHGFNGNNRMPATLYEQKYLNTTPPCGSKYYEHEEGSTVPPWHTMSLMTPWHGEGSADDYEGEYNMVDFMLLYNLYFSNYLLDIMLTPYKTSNIEAPTYIEPPPPHEPRWEWTIDEPYKTKAAIQIEVLDNINFNGGAEYTAGKSIKFLPGFYAKAGSNVKSTIDPSLFDRPYYVKTNIDPCDGGVFYPLHVTYTPAVYPKTIDEETVYESIQLEKRWNETGLLMGGHEEKSSLIGDTQGKTKDFVAYPNPTCGIFQFRLPDSDLSCIFTLLDFTGRVVYTKELENLTEGLVTFDLSSYNCGIYFVHIHNEETYNRIKIVKK